MKVILLTDWGGAVPRFLDPYIKREPKLWRVDQQLIQKIETTAIPYDAEKRYADKSDIIMSLRECVIATDDTAPYRYVGIGATVNFTIQEVDIDRPWTVLAYDGAEYIQYLDYTYLDTQCNYCQLVD